MANVLLIEGWGLTGGIVDDLGPAAPDMLRALGWEVTRGSLSSGQTLLNVVQGEHLRLSGSAATANGGCTPFRNVGAVPSLFAAGWSATATWGCSNNTGPGFYLHTSPIVDSSPGRPTYTLGVWVQRLADGQMRIQHSNGTTVTSGSAVTPLFVEGLPNWVELVIDKVNREARLWLNNELVSTTGLPASVDTVTDAAFSPRVAGSASFTTVNGEINMGHAYVADQRLGRCQVITRFPTEDVAVQFTRPQGDSNASQVADRGGSDGDDSYVRSATTNNQDRYGSDDPIPLTNERIHAVGVTVAGRKEDVGLRSVTPIIERSGTTVAGTPIFLNVTPYIGGQSVFSEDPGTGTDWTLAGAEAHTFGMRLTE